MSNINPIQLRAAALQGGDATFASACRPLPGILYLRHNAFMQLQICTQTHTLWNEQPQCLVLTEKICTTSVHHARLPIAEKHEYNGQGLGQESFRVKNSGITGLTWRSSLL